MMQKRSAEEQMNDAKAFWRYMLKTNPKFKEQIKKFHEGSSVIVKRGETNYEIEKQETA